MNKYIRIVMKKLRIKKAAAIKLEKLNHFVSTIPEASERVFTPEELEQTRKDWAFWREKGTHTTEVADINNLTMADIIEAKRKLTDVIDGMKYAPFDTVRVRAEDKSKVAAMPFNIIESSIVQKNKALLTDGNNFAGMIDFEDGVVILLTREKFMELRHNWIDVWSNRMRRRTFLGKNMRIYEEEQT